MKEKIKELNTKKRSKTTGDTPNYQMATRLFVDPEVADYLADRNSE